jgi:hypothetical protein
LIAVRRNFWIRPLSSLVEGPLRFGAKELRRLYPQAWDKSIRKREAWFRNDLNALFAGPKYQCLTREIQLFEGTRTLTDVDAAIIDLEARRLALFQLKWQEPIGLEEAERRSRALRLRTEALKWVTAIRELVRTRGAKDLALQLGLSEELHDAAASAHLFVVVRHHARFSGFPVLHPDCAIASWRQFQRARLEMGPRADTFGDLFSRFKAEETRPVDHRTEFAKFSVAGFDVEAEHFLVADENHESATPHGGWGPWPIDPELQATTRRV